MLDQDETGLLTDLPAALFILAMWAIAGVAVTWVYG